MNLSFSKVRRKNKLTKRKPQETDKNKKTVTVYNPVENISSSFETEQFHNETKSHKTANNQSNPIQNNKQNGQIISGYFLDEKPYKEMIITRLNNFLYILLGILVVFCFVGYYFVSCKEVQLNKISRATLELNYENDELQNKIDSLQSYYNIDKAVSKTNFLERAKQVVEVNAIGTPDINLNKANKKRQLVISY